MMCVCVVCVSVCVQDAVSDVRVLCGVCMVCVWCVQDAMSDRLQ